MKRKYDIGDQFKLTSDAIDNYGAAFADRVFTVRQWFDHYVKPADMRRVEHGHPGYDAATGDCLYEADGLNFAVYEWEMEEA